MGMVKCMETTKWGGYFSDVLGFAVLLGVYQTPSIHMAMYCFYSCFIDSTFQIIFIVLRIADLWRL